MGSVKGYTKVIEKIATVTGAILVGVEYRLLPDSGDGFSCRDDCYHAARWLIANKRAVGGQASSKFGVIGDSGGGCLTLLTGLDVKGIDFEVTIFPAPNMRRDTGTAKEFYDIPLLCTKDFDWMESLWKGIKNNPVAIEDPRFFPYYREDVSMAPPQLMLIPDLDPYRDAMLLFAAKLRKAKVSVKVGHFSGVPHSFTSFLGAFPKTSGMAFDEIAAFVKTF